MSIDIETPSYEDLEVKVPNSSIRNSEIPRDMTRRAREMEKEADMQRNHSSEKTAEIMEKIYADYWSL